MKHHVEIHAMLRFERRL